MLHAGFEAGLQSDSEARAYGDEVETFSSFRGARSANPESVGRIEFTNLWIPDPALCAGPE
jgi:hypothetical protein